MISLPAALSKRFGGGGGRLLNVQFVRNETRDYSAACATFMRPAASSTDLTML